MAPEPTAGQIGQYDQSLAAALAVIDRLVGDLQTTAADVGEPQALAETELAGLFTAALWRLAGQAGQYDQPPAGATAEIDLLLGVLQTRVAEVGEPQALRLICALVSGKGAAELADLLKATVRQLAGLSGKSGH
jgi:hypothetical protein